jgi:amidohydrolase
MVRADIDALPIEEENDISYASTHKGCMHACGHDGHMAIALTVAKILARNRDMLKGNVKFVFQPAEEGPGGAKIMIDEGVLDNPRVDAAIGLHIWNYLPVGSIGIRPGPLMAAMDSFNLVVNGKGAHGAIPQDGVDAIVISTQVIAALQTIVSREIPPINPCVVTIGTIKGGKAFNIIADSVQMEGTVRALDPEMHKTLPERMERIISSVTSGMRAGYEFSYDFLYPILKNETKMTQLVTGISKMVVGKDKVVVAEQTMGGEDMAFFLERVPGCYFFLGSSNHEKGLSAPHHSSRFNFDEKCLTIGAEIMAGTVLKYLDG